MKKEIQGITLYSAFPVLFIAPNTDLFLSCLPCLDFEIQSTGIIFFLPVNSSCLECLVYS